MNFDECDDCYQSHFISNNPAARVARTSDVIVLDDEPEEDNYIPYFNDEDVGIFEYPAVSPTRNDLSACIEILELDDDAEKDDLYVDEQDDWRLFDHYSRQDDDVREAKASTSSTTNESQASTSSSTTSVMAAVANSVKRNKERFTVSTAEELLSMKGRVNLADLLTPVRPTRKTAKSISVQDEFFGVYCLISRSENKAYKNRCYIGYTVNPNRRIRQHNAGRQFGGAKKTDSRGPWDMVCIIHGFPNSISALRFEWAWQNPAKSKRLRDFESLQRKARNQTPFEYRLRIACRMLNSDPWRRLALTFRWLLPECAIPFPADLPPPPHVKMAHGVVTKTETIVPTELNAYTGLENCRICVRPIVQLKRLLRCLNFDSCGAHFHVHCWAEKELAAQGELHTQLTPLEARCPICARTYLWGDLIRAQRVLCAIDNAKPCLNGVRIADGLIPRQINKL